MKKRVLSIFFILIISMLGLVSCDIVKGKDYVATGNEYFEFIEREGDTYALDVKDGVTLPEKVKLPSEYNGKPVVEIVANAFKNNATIKEVIIPVGYEIIGIEAFAYCAKLSSVNVGQYGVGDAKGLTIRASAFKGCSNLTSVTLGECVENIDAYAFYETGVIEINNRGLKKVGYCAFGNCSSLKRFYVPATLVQIDEGAFNGSKGVSFEVSSSNPVYVGEDGKLVTK